MVRGAVGYKMSLRFEKRSCIVSVFFFKFCLLHFNEKTNFLLLSFIRPSTTAFDGGSDGWRG